MPAVLAINPNTSSSISERIGHHLRAAEPSVEWRLATGAFGEPYIVTEAAAAVAGHAAVDCWQRGHRGCDAVLLACFGDPGLFALRELSAAPVAGLAEASMRVARRAAQRFSIVTGGARWKPMLERLAASLGFAESLASVRTIALTGAQAAADPDAAITLLAAESRAARETDGAGAVILGGAGFAGLAARVSPLAGFSVIDSVEAGAHEVAALAGGARWPYERPGS